MKKCFLMMALFSCLFLIWQWVFANNQINKINSSICQDEQNNVIGSHFAPVNVDGCEFDELAQIEGWRIYSDKQKCFRIQYRDDWHYYKYNETTEAYSLEAVAFNDTTIDPLLTDENKIVIRNYNNYPIGLVVEASALIDPDIGHFRSLEDFRIRGNYRNERPGGWVYSDTVYLSNYITGQVMTISYYEKEYSEENRKIFDSMLDSIEFGH